MSVQTEIDRIITAVQAAHEKVVKKGGTTTQPYLVANLASAIDTIPNATALVLQAKTVTPTTAKQTIKPDSGYDGLSQVDVNAMPTATQATPSITVSSGGLITAKSTQTAGYVASGTKQATKKLTTQVAKTVTPTKSSQTAVASGVYTTGAVTVAAIPDTYIQPIGTLEVTENGTHDVKNYASVNVNVAGGGGGGENVACTVEILADAPVTATEFTYLDANFVFQKMSVSAMDLMMGTTITCVKNSVIHSTQPVLVDSGGVSTKTLKSFDGTFLAVLGDGTFVID